MLNIIDMLHKQIDMVLTIDFVNGPIIMNSIYLFSRTDSNEG